MSLSSVTTLVALALFVGCAADRTGVGSSDSSADIAEAGDAPALTSAIDSGLPGEIEWFTDRAEAAGLDFTHFNGMSGEFYFPEIMPPGVGLLDYDNDDDLDVYLVQGQMLGPGKTLSQALVPPQGPLPVQGRLYRNNLTVQAGGTRTLRFVDVTDQSEISAREYGMGVATGDIDNDGWVDLYLTNFGSNQLYRNNGDGTFTDVSRQSGTDDPRWSVSASFVDYDRDGWLDLYVGNYANYSLETDQRCTKVAGRRDYCPPNVYQGQPDRLYRNQGDGTLLDVTATTLPGAPVRPALGVSTADFNDDGWIDIYVANDGQENHLWMNQADGTFKNEGLLSGAVLSDVGTPEASMGVDAGDFDNDGDEDLVMTHLTGEGSNVYVNDGSGTFEDRSARSGLGSLSLAFTGFGTSWLDFDNDGWLDVLSVNGTVEAIERQADNFFPYDQPTLLFRNLRNGLFEEVSRRAGVAFAISQVGRGAAFGDVDNDGDTDVLVGNLSGPVRLLINGVGNRNHWVGLRLVGEEAPRHMLGARVAVERADGSMLWRRARADGSYASANDPRVLVGLGASAAATVRVYWPSGRVEEWLELAGDRWQTLMEGAGRHFSP